MEVIQPGPGQPNWKREAICLGDLHSARSSDYGCGASLRLTSADIFKNSDSPYSNTGVYTLNFICSQCHMTTTLEDKCFDRRLVPDYQDWLKQEKERSKDSEFV